MLRHLPTPDDPNVLVGFETGDDAAVYRLSADRALVQTLDVITPVVDDPRAFGRIAAANAVSDIYAMGGRPVLALNILGIPSGKISWDVVGEILKGGAEKAREAGVTIPGGHSLDDPEPKYGLVVTGFVHPDHVVRNATPAVGDALLLTKPLGMGIITTGGKQQRTSDATLAQAIAVMETLNHAASEAMLEVGVSAATDVTGFGLLGHLRTMLGAASAVVHLPAVPVLDEAWTLARAAIVPAGTYRNRRSLARSVHWEDGIEEWQQLVVCDAQTSGGLLLSLPQDRVDLLQRALRARGAAPAAVVGEITPGEPGTIIVRK